MGECVGGHSEQGGKKCVAKKAPRHKTNGKSEGTENRVKKRSDTQKTRKKQEKCESQGGTGESGSEWPPSEGCNNAAGGKVDIYPALHN